MTAALLALSIFLAGTSFAAEPQPDAPAVSVDQAAVDEALRMLEVDQFESQMIEQSEVMIEGMLAMEIKQLREQSDEPPPEDLIKQLAQALRDHSRDTLKGHSAEIKRQAAEIYAREFTVEELRRLREIAAEPVMVKQRAKGQKLNAQLMMLGVDVMRQSQPELQRKIEEIVADYLEKAGLVVDEKS